MVFLKRSMSTQEEYSIKWNTQFEKSFMQNSNILRFVPMKHFLNIAPLTLNPSFDLVKSKYTFVHMCQG